MILIHDVAGYVLPVQMETNDSITKVTEKTTPKEKKISEDYRKYSFLITTYL